MMEPFLTLHPERLHKIASVAKLVVSIITNNVLLCDTVKKSRKIANGV